MVSMPPVTGGLVIALAADNITDPAGAISSWPNPAGYVANATGTPHLVEAATPTGGPVVRFANDGYFTFSSNSLFTQAAATSAELFVVLRSALPATSENVGPYQFGGGDNTYYTYSDGNHYDGSFTATRFQYAPATPTGWHVLNVTHDGTTWRVLVDNVEQTSQATAFYRPDDSPLWHLRVGASGADFAYWAGDIAELVAYSRSLTDAERGQVVTYLRRHLTMQAPALRLGLHSFTPTWVEAPALAAGLAGRAAMAELVDAPPLGLDLTSHGRQLLAVAAPALSLDLAATPANVMQVVQVEPADGAAVPSSVPRLSVAAMVDGGLARTVTIELAADADFTDPQAVTARVDFQTRAGLPNVLVVWPQPLADGVWHWRARMGTSTGDSAWTPGRTLHVDTVAAMSTLTIPGSCTITDDPPPGHLWFTVPTAARPGETVTCYGTGLPVAGSAHLGGRALPVSGHAAVTDATDPAEALIDAAGGRVAAVACQSVTFTVPADMPGPGGPLTIEA